MCHVLWYGDEEHPQYVCYLHDRESAEDYADMVADVTELTINVSPMPIREALRSRIPYWEKVNYVFTRSETAYSD